MHRDPSDAEAALFSALVYLQRQRTTQDQSPSRQRLSEHLAERARRLNRERLLTEELLQRIADNPALLPRRVQRELQIAGAPGGTAAGRFDVRNRSGEPARFELVFGSPMDGEPSLPVRFEPASAELAVGEARRVRVVADLSRLGPGRSLTLPVECRWPTGSDRLWLIVSTEE